MLQSTSITFWRSWSLKLNVNKTNASKPASNTTATGKIAFSRQLIRICASLCTKNLPRQSATPGTLTYNDLHAGRSRPWF